MKLSSILITFVQSETEELWSRLEKWQNSLENKMSAETYFKMCEQLGQEPDPARTPPDITDFPPDVQSAIAVFNKLGDRIVADIGYLGKDYTALDLHMRVMGVQNEELFIETLLRLDERLIKKSSEEVKRARDKAKRGAKTSPG